jgi:hypothetical protein
MFEIKYDRDGAVIRDREQAAQIQQAANTFEQEQVVEAAAPEPEAQEFQQQEEVSEQQEAVEQPEPEQARSLPPQSDDEDSGPKKSIRDLKEAKKRAERERDDYLRRLTELEARSQTQQPTQPEEDEELHIGSDDIAEGKHLSKVDQRAQRKIKQLEDRLSKYESKTNEERIESALKQKYSDFDKVVSRENVELLSEAYPELAKTIHANGDLYSKAVSAYTLIKKFGIYQESQSPFSSDKAVAMRNASKPRAVNSVAPQQGEQGALSRANAFASGLTDDVKTQLYKEMMAARKGY